MKILLSKEYLGIQKHEIICPVVDIVAADAAVAAEAIKCDIETIKMIMQGDSETVYINSNTVHKYFSGKLMYKESV